MNAPSPMGHLDLYETICAASEQHGLDDMDTPTRERDDLCTALGVAVGLLADADPQGIIRLAVALEREGMLAGWVNV